MTPPPNPNPKVIVLPAAHLTTGWTALHQAAYQGNLEMVQWLLNQGADKKAVTAAGQTAADVLRNFPT